MCYSSSKKKEKRKLDGGSTCLFVFPKSQTNYSSTKKKSHQPTANITCLLPKLKTKRPPAILFFSCCCCVFNHRLSVHTKTLGEHRTSNPRRQEVHSFQLAVARGRGHVLVVSLCTREGVAIFRRTYAPFIKTARLFCIHGSKAVCMYSWERKKKGVQPWT